ncbi:unnamed protein product, partial [Amoebophrya sp. A25]
VAVRVKTVLPPHEEKNPLYQLWVALHSGETVSAAVVLSFLVCFILCFLPSMTAARLEREEASKAKLHILLTGISHMQYWWGVFVWDFLSYYLVLWMFNVLFLLYRIPYFGAFWSKYGAAASTIFSLFIVATLLLTYCCSHLKNEVLPRL